MAQKIIDVSSWQHVSGAAIDWAAVAASGVTGVIIKATQGLTYANPYFASDFAEANHAGLLVGAYHFAEPAPGTPAEEAAWCNNHVAGLELPLGLWLDLEQMSAGGPYETQTWATDWVNSLAVATRKTGIYMNQSFLTQMPALFPAYPLWFATGGTETPPEGATIVQGAKALTEGIIGLVDQDLIVSDRWVNPPGPTPTPAPPASTVKDEDMRYVVAEGEAVEGVNPGDQYIWYPNHTKYPVTATGDAESFVKTWGEPQPLSCAFLANIKNA